MSLQYFGGYTSHEPDLPATEQVKIPVLGLKASPALLYNLSQVTVTGSVFATRVFPRIAENETVFCLTTASGFVSEVNIRDMTPYFVKHFLKASLCMSTIRMDKNYLGLQNTLYCTFCCFVCACLIFFVCLYLCVWGECWLCLWGYICLCVLTLNCIRYPALPLVHNGGFHGTPQRKPLSHWNF